MIDPWLGLLLMKMAVAAAIVVSCSLLAERSGPLLAAMIATLPISAGPVYAFLAMDHDAAFISASALGSLSPISPMPGCRWSTSCWRSASAR